MATLPDFRRIKTAPDFPGLSVAQSGTGDVRTPVLAACDEIGDGAVAGNSSDTLLLLTYSGQA